MAFTIGVDYGTESGRVLLLDLVTSREVALHVVPYAHGVVERALPESGVKLGADWALQHPQDYLDVLTLGIPAVLQKAGVKAHEVIGIGIDFTSCTVLPALSDGTPLCLTARFAQHPHAWPKLWKHHAAQKFADRITEVAEARGEEFLARYGGRISSEWYFPKLLEVFVEDRFVYEHTAAFVEATDWIVWQLTGSLKRNSCTAGYKALRDDEGQLPDVAFFQAVQEGFADPGKLLGQEFYEIGTKAGYLTPEWASRLGISNQVAVAVGNVDAHVSVPGAGISRPGSLVMVVGTSICHLAVAEEQKLVVGMTGVVKDGILPGLYGYESGQAAVGDMLAWFIRECVTQDYKDEAMARGISTYELLEDYATKLVPGESGLVVLDWWNGNRSVLGDADLGGMIVGFSLSTKSHEIYHAMLESIAFGTRRIIENFVEMGISFAELVACGGLAHKSPLLMQLYANVCNIPVTVRASQEIAARGAALFGAVAAGEAAGGFAGVGQAIAALAPTTVQRYEPQPEVVKQAEESYQLYRVLYELMGRDQVAILHSLKRRRQSVLGEAVRRA